MCVMQSTGICQDEGSRLQPHALAGGVSADAYRSLGGRSWQVLHQRVPQPLALHWASYRKNEVGTTTDSRF